MLDFLYPPLEWRDWRDDWPLARCSQFANSAGLRWHYQKLGQGPVLLLLHGTPKTHFYWHKLIPLLTPHFTVVAPDLRGFGDTDKPPAEEGYDSLTNAKDVAALMTHLGHDSFHLHGEDRGAEFAYALAATEPLMREYLTRDPREGDAS